MKRRGKILIATTVAVATFAVAAFVVLNQPDDYQLWKRGQKPFRDDFKVSFMLDVDRDSMVIGKTRDDPETQLSQGLIRDGTARSSLSERRRER